MKKAIQAYYKGRPFWQAVKHGDWFDLAVRIRTLSKYSHTELIVDGVWYSSSYRDGGVRAKVINPNPEHWDYELVYIDEKHALNLFQKYKGRGYDVVGILFSQAIKLNVHEKLKHFCTEFNAEQRKLKTPQSYSPAKMARRNPMGIHCGLTQFVIDQYSKG